MQWQDRISVDPHVCHGKACIKGTRVMVSVILDNLAAGEPPDQIAQAYHVTPDDVHAALLYAAELSKERIVPLKTQGVLEQGGRGSRRAGSGDGPGLSRSFALPNGVPTRLFAQAELA